MVQYSLFFVLVLAIGANACTPGNEAILTQLLSQLGIAPLTGSEGADGNGATGDFVTDPAQLNCNFENIATCRWQNLPEGGNPAVDTEEYFLFEVSTIADGFPLLSPIGRQPPTGSKVLLVGSQTATPGAVWMSDPIACNQQTSTLTFEYWLFGKAEVRVILLDPTTNDLIWTAPNKCTAGTLLNPGTGICTTSIPPQTAPYKVGIQGINLPNAFVIVDNVVYSSPPFGAACDGSLIFGTTSSALVSGNTGTPVTAGSELTCTDPLSTACKWANDGVGPEFEVHTGTVDSAKWLAATGTSITPDGEFLMTTGNPGDGPAILKSELIECTTGTGTVTLKAWMTETVVMKVCLKNSATNAVVQCQTLSRTAGPDYTVSLTAPAPVENAVVEISAENWGTGGMAAVDDLTYDFPGCSAILIGNANTEMIPYTGAPVGPIGENALLACTVDTPDQCHWGDPDPANQWWWVNNVDPAKLQSFTGTSTVPTSGAAYYEFGEANQYVFFGSDQLFCVNTGGDLKFNVWASSGVIVEVCAVVFSDPPREVCKGAVPVTSPGPLVTSFTATELSTSAPLVFIITIYSPTAPGFIMIDNLEYTGDVCPDPTLVSNDELVCQSLSTTFDSLTTLPPGWFNCQSGCAGGAPSVPWKPTDQVLGFHNIRVRGPTGSVKPHLSSSLFVVEDGNGFDQAPGISILQSIDFQFDTERYLSFSYQRGTFGSQLYVCKNEVPALVRRDIPLFHPSCEKIAGPQMYAEEWYDGAVGGYLVTPDIQRLYIVHTAPWKYTYGESHALLDDLVIHEGSTPDTAPLCLPTA